VSALVGLPELTSLDLSGAKNLTDLTPLGQLTELRALNLSNCPKVSDLAPLAKLRNLTSLTLSDCEKVRDLRRCPNVPTEDVEWLKRQLPECQVLHE